LTKQQAIHIARTGLAALIGLAPFAPELVAKLGMSTTVGVGATLVAVSAAFVKVTQTPVVNAKLKAWLKY
jgi:hypothetical protein